MKIFSDEADLEWIFLDGTHVRAHQHSAGIKRNFKSAVALACIYI